MRITITPAIVAAMIGLATAAQAAPVPVTAQSAVVPLAGDAGSVSTSDGEKQIKARGPVDELIDNALKCVGLCRDNLKDLRSALKYGLDWQDGLYIERHIKERERSADQVSEPITRHEWIKWTKKLFDARDADRLLKYAPPKVKPARPTLPKSMSMP